MRRNLIRFRPKGCKGYYVFDIVVIKKGKKIKGNYVERLGFFNPNVNEHLFFLDTSRLGYWLNKGAVLTGSLKSYLAKFCI